VGLPKGHVASWFNDLSIRSRAVLFGLLMLVPVLAILLWLLAADVRHARNSANEKVQILAAGTATDLRRMLDQSETILRRLAQRPQVRALDPQKCDTTVAEFVPLNPGYLTVDVRDARGNLVCSFLSNLARPMTPGESHWFDAALRSGKFMASDVVVGPRTGKRIVALSYPILDGNGSQSGLIVMALDLLALNKQLLAGTPANALLTVVDRSRALLTLGEANSPPESCRSDRPCTSAVAYNTGAAPCHSICSPRAPTSRPRTDVAPKHCTTRWMPARTPRRGTRQRKYLLCSAWLKLAPIRMRPGRAPSSARSFLRCCGTAPGQLMKTRPGSRF